LKQVVSEPSQEEHAISLVKPPVDGFTVEFLMMPAHKLCSFCGFRAMRASTCIKICHFKNYFVDPKENKFVSDDIW
jgi:ferredoxin